MFDDPINKTTYDRRFREKEDQWNCEYKPSEVDIICLLPMG